MKILLFGATGLAGGSVLKACLAAPSVEEVRALTRRALATSDWKLQNPIHDDFLDYRRVAGVFEGLDACLFCLGTSATQTPGEADYRRITHDFSLAAARMVAERSPQAAFHFISGMGTRPDSRFMWARVKAETERDLMAEVGAVCWRPAFIDGETSGTGPPFYKWLKPLGRLMAPFPSLYVLGEDIGRAMLQATNEGVRGRIIENAEIRTIARRAEIAAA